jgi:EpsI family protein
MTETPNPDPAANLSRRHIIMGLGMLGVAGVASQRLPQTSAKPIESKTFDAMIPRKIGPWEVYTSSEFVLPPPDAMTARLYDNLVTRAYVAADKPTVLMLIAYNNSQDGVLQVHRPEVCYPVAGYKLTETQILEIPKANGRPLRVRSFTASAPTRTEHVLYWTRVGPHMPTSWAEQRWAVIEENLKKIEPDGMMVRLSVVSDDTPLALATMKSFAKDFSGTLPSASRQLLFGA